MKKHTKSNIFVIAVCLIISAIVGYAQTAFAAPIFTSGSDLKGIISSVVGLFNSLIPLLIGAAIVVFLYGIFIFIAKSSAGNAEGHKEGINFMIYGIIGIAVMVSVWGLVQFITNSIGTSSGPGVVPQLNTNSSQSGYVPQRNYPGQSQRTPGF